MAAGRWPLSQQRSSLRGQVQAANPGRRCQSRLGHQSRAPALRGEWQDTILSLCRVGPVPGGPAPAPSRPRPGDCACAARWPRARATCHHAPGGPGPFWSDPIELTGLFCASRVNPNLKRHVALGLVLKLTPGPGPPFRRGAILTHGPSWNRQKSKTEEIEENRVDY